MLTLICLMSIANHVEKVMSEYSIFQVLLHQHKEAGGLPIGLANDGTMMLRDSLFCYINASSK